MRSKGCSFLCWGREHRKISTLGRGNSRCIAYSFLRPNKEYFKSYKSNLGSIGATTVEITARRGSIITTKALFS